MLTETTRTDAVPATTAVDARAPERNPALPWPRRHQEKVKSADVRQPCLRLVRRCVPLLFMVFSSFKKTTRSSLIINRQGVPSIRSLSLLTTPGIPSGSRLYGSTNSLIVTVAIVLLGLIVNSMISLRYRMRWGSKNIVLSLVPSHPHGSFRDHRCAARILGRQRRHRCSGSLTFLSNRECSTLSGADSALRCQCTLRSCSPSR